VTSGKRDATSVCSCIFICIPVKGPSVRPPDTALSSLLVVEGVAAVIGLAMKS
jgi:hypothetical protein